MSRTTRKVRQGKVEIDYTDPALVVNYELETVVLDDNNRVVEVIEALAEQKRIKIKSLAADKDMGQMAADIVDKCKYIHPSRTEEIEQLLIKLRKHFNSKESEKDKAESKRQDDRDRASRERDDEEDEGAYNSASMDNLSDYLDLLYQVSGSSDHEKDSGLKSQIHGTKMILSLCQDVMNLEQLIQNTTVMGALTRVLQEEYKKSLELSFNILRIFLAFSNFTEMHGLMANYRVGLLTMKVIEFEVRRAEHRNEELALRDAPNDAEDGDPKRPLENSKKSREREERKWKKQSKKQDKVLFVAFYILINLAEDVSVEQKMLKKGLVESLLNMLNRTYGELLILLITFLKKLSIFEENKTLFKSLKCVPKLARFIPCTSQPLTNMSLRLLFNLSFDEELRDQMMCNGLVPKLVDLLKTPAFRSRTLKLLYHLSIDDRCKSMFSYTDGVPLLMGMVINFPQDTLAKELAALVINISHSPKNCELMVQNHGLNHLMDRLGSTRDPLLIKIIRNITCWTFNQQQELEQPELHYKWRGLWSPHLKIFLEITKESDNHDVLVEVYGCLANMTPLDLPASSSWHRIAKEVGTDDAPLFLAHIPLSVLLLQPVLQSPGPGNVPKRHDPGDRDAHRGYGIGREGLRHAVLQQPHQHAVPDMA